MAKQKIQLKDLIEPTQPQSGGLPAPFTLGKLQEMVLNLYFQQARTIGWMKGDAAIGWEIIGKPTDGYEGEFFDPDFDPEHLGLRYDAICNTNFAKCIENMYQYAYFGILDESGEQMDYESTYTWMTSILSDMKNSQMFYELETYGSFSLDDAEKCFQVAELANARIVLEGGENFFYFGHSNKDNKDDDSTGFDGLTVRQMALLSGMEEMSIRAAANPKRANPLPTYSEDGRTRISIESAKAWLQAKGRYVAIKRQWGTGELDLAKRKFSTVDELAATLDARFQMLVLRDQQEEGLTALLSGLGIKTVKSTYEAKNYLAIDAGCISNGSLIAKLAEILELPADLLALRAREALARDELASVDRELRILAEAQNDHGNKDQKGGK